MKQTLRTCSRGHEYAKSSNCPVCPICWPKYYKDKAQSDFPKLAAPALRALQHAGIKKMADLANWTEENLAALHGMGPHALEMLTSEMKKRGESFKE